MTEESKVEKGLCDMVKDLGGHAYKFVSPGRTGVPDRLCVLPEGVVFFVECKGLHGKLRSGQERELVRLKRMGHHAYYVDTIDQVNYLCKLMVREIEDATSKL